MDAVQIRPHPTGVNSRKKIGTAIRQRRLQLGYSQEGFAQWAGIERARYGRIERGEMNLTIDKLLELAAHLDIEPYRLLQDVTIYDCMGVQSDDEVG